MGGDWRQEIEVDEQGFFCITLLILVKDAVDRFGFVFSKKKCIRPDYV